MRFWSEFKLCFCYLGHCVYPCMLPSPSEAPFLFLFLSLAHWPALIPAKQGLRRTEFGRSQLAYNFTNDSVVDKWSSPGKHARQLFVRLPASPDLPTAPSHTVRDMWEVGLQTCNIVQTLLAQGSGSLLAWLLPLPARIHHQIGKFPRDARSKTFADSIRLELVLKNSRTCRCQVHRPEPRCKSGICEARDSRKLIR